MIQPSLSTSRRSASFPSFARVAHHMPLVAALGLVGTSLGCAPQQQGSPPATAATSTTAAAHPPPGGERPVYRFDFVLTSDDGSSAPTSTAFTLNMRELDEGQVLVRKNVPLSLQAAPGAPSGPRQDVGMKVAAEFQTVGDKVLLNVKTEMSSVDGAASIRRVAAKSSALATPGKSALVTTLEDEHRHYRLDVVPTKLQ